MPQSVHWKIIVDQEKCLGGDIVLNSDYGHIALTFEMEAGPDDHKLFEKYVLYGNAKLYDEIVGVKAQNSFDQWLNCSWTYGKSSRKVTVRRDFRFGAANEKCVKAQKFVEDALSKTRGLLHWTSAPLSEPKVSFGYYPLCDTN